MRLAPLFLHLALHLAVLLALPMALASAPARAAFPAPARAPTAMAATASPYATDAALAILDDGGNAVDAAVAAALVISVVNPFDTGLGGGGFAVVHLAGKDGKAPLTRALDFRERAPAAATRDMFLGPDGKVIEGLSLDGHKSVAVPGTVAGLRELHRAHGRLPWRLVVKPAVDVARNGFVITDEWVASFEWRKDVLTRFDATRAAFMKRDATGAQVPFDRGDVLRQRDLARTLVDIARDARSFYEGRVARAIVAEMERGGGLVSAADLKGYQPVWREPLCAPWRDLQLCTMPPPSSGGVALMQILRLLDGTDLKALGWHHPDAVHRMIEAMRIAYADRATHLGDPAFTPVPVAELTSPGYAALRRKEFDGPRARASADVKAATPEQLATLLKESADTSHLSVVDGERNAVSLTFTVNYGFGSGVIVPGTGVLLNDEMDDFAAAPGVPNAFGLVGGDANSVQPGKVPLSSMTPLIATREGRFFLSAGSPGGSTIITTVLQTLLHVVDYGMDCQAAVAAPRLHHQWLPETTRLEELGFDTATRGALELRGHAFKVTGGWGNAMCIRARDDGTLEGGADPRGEGVARGL